MNHVVLEKLLYQLLKTNSNIDEVWGHVIPPHVTLPTVMFAPLSSSDLRGMGDGGPILVEALYQVKAVGPAASWTQLADLAGSIDSTLSGASYGADGYRIEVVRVRPLAYIEKGESEQYRHLGGVYRIVLYQD